MLRKPATAVTMARLPHAQIASFVDLKQLGFNLVFFMSVTGLTGSSLWTSAPIAKKTPDASPEPHSHGYGAPILFPTLSAFSPARRRSSRRKIKVHHPSRRKIKLPLGLGDRPAPPRLESLDYLFLVRSGITCHIIESYQTKSLFCRTA